MNQGKSNTMNTKTKPIPQTNPTWTCKLLSTTFQFLRGIKHDQTQSQLLRRSHPLATSRNPHPLRRPSHPARMHPPRNRRLPPRPRRNHNAPQRPRTPLARGATRCGTGGERTGPVWQLTEYRVQIPSLLRFFLKMAGND